MKRSKDEAPGAGGTLPTGEAHMGHGLQHLPLPLFAAPMGIGGLGLAWREAGKVLGAPTFIGEALLALAAAIWVVVAALHVVRALRHPEAIGGDLKHPVRAAFAGAITIGVMITAGGLIPYSHGAASGLWFIAVAGHLGIGAWTVRRLLASPQEAAALTPPLLIPLVGNILAPVFGARLGYETLSWMLFGVGALLWALIQPLILNRIISGPALPERLRPTLVILLAPPAVGAIALNVLGGGYGPAATATLGLAVFVALVLAAMAPAFARIPFAMSWWAWTFPSAAFTVAVTSFYHAHPLPLLGIACWVLLALASAIIATVVIATLKAAAAGHLLQPEG